MTRQSHIDGDPASRSPGGIARLNGWKEIAASLGKDERTVKRWAVERGLPVHRVPGEKRASIYAWSNEIENWLRTKPSQVEIVVASGQPDPRPPRSSVSRLVLGLACAGAGLVFGTVGILAWNGTRGPTAATSVARLHPQLPQSTNQLYLDAMYLWQKRTPETLQQAEGLLLRVVQQAPQFAAAEADLATVYNLMVEYGVLTASEGYAKSEQAAKTALALDPNNVQSLAVLGDLAFFWHHDYSAGLAGFERALAIDPDHALSRQWYASALMSAGQFREADGEIEKARRLDPTSRSIQVSMAMIAIGLGELDRSSEILTRLTHTEPDYRSPYRFLSFIALAKHDRPGYLLALANRFRLTHDAAGRQIADAGMDHISAATEAEFGSSMLQAARSQTATVEPYFLAHLLALSGQWEAAAEQLGRTPTRQAFYYSLDPAFAEARSSPLFVRRIAQLGMTVVP